MADWDDSELEQGLDWGDWGGGSSGSGADKTAMVIEIVFGLFGLLGMGWLYAGQILTAVLVFLGYLLLSAYSKQTCGI